MEIRRQIEFGHFVRGARADDSLFRNRREAAVQNLLVCRIRVQTLNTSPVHGPIFPPVPHYSIEGPHVAGLCWIYVVEQDHAILISRHNIAFDDCALQPAICVKPVDENQIEFRSDRYGFFKEPVRRLGDPQ